MLDACGRFVVVVHRVLVSLVCGDLGGNLLGDVNRVVEKLFNQAAENIGIDLAWESDRGI